ncbi:glycosyltransferase family 2 protein [Thiocystis violascens]|uniref:Glycosyl transferase n=1 Tax=Thiocystis violascens (strain ATCC 17096 / DSM 198 / 6111) TaxID=765911 RepID=I3Y5E5_THIV6|nr:glycosyltransferase family 2 protein [Thiocystis violascens]AFL72213.1 glycosyl transferase [Thiocystis violascens DSM 198]
MKHATHESTPDTREVSLSIILPAKNEAPTIGPLLDSIAKFYPHAELLVVDDGSTDGTPDIARERGARVITHPYSLGNGASVKSGARAARGDVLIFMDADGQHDPADIPRLLARLEAGYDMAVGARGKDSQASPGRRIANGFYNWFASLMTGFRVRDLTSGFRAARAEPFRRFLYLLPNGFSYPTTITMAFFRSGNPIDYVPIVTARRGSARGSHIRPIKDGIRFLLIIFKVATLYSPLKLFFPVSLAFFLAGAANYLNTFITMHRFTNMSALLFSAAVIVLMMGLVSEQITATSYREADR